jgi:hypothetical protein
MSKDVSAPKPVSVSKVVADFKNIDFDNTSASSKAIFIAPNGKKLIIDDILISGLNKNANPIIVAVQVWKNGSWQTLIAAGNPGIGVFNNSHAFNGEIILDAGNGSDPVIRAVKTGTSTSWQTSITAVGHLA